MPALQQVPIVTGALIQPIKAFDKSKLTGYNTLRLNPTQTKGGMYGKLFEQMYDGTLATKGPWEALVTFQQFIILADQHGVVDMTADAISRRTTIPLKIIETGIEALEQPDGGSRSPELEGRRITRLAENRNWGWQITNYEHYRNLRSQEERRAYHRHYWHGRKDRIKTQQTQQASTNSTHAVSSKHKQKELKPLASSDSSLSAPAVGFIPLVGGKEWPVPQNYLNELEAAYPAVDGPATLKEIRVWCVSNPRQCKTERGVKRFLNRWFERIQNGTQRR